MSHASSHQTKHSTIGPVPQDWLCITLHDVCAGDLQTGPFGSQLHANEYVEDGISVLMPRDLVAYKASVGSSSKITHDRAQSLAKHRLEIGDLLFSRRGDVSRFALIDSASRGALCGTGCLRARPSKKHSPSYLSYVLQLEAITDWLEQNAVGQTMPNMNTTILASLPLVVPPSKAEQQKIAAILTAVDDKLDVIARQITATQALKQGLMQNLFTKGVGIQGDDGRWMPHTEFKQTALGAIPVRWSVGVVGDFVLALSSGVSVNGEDRTRQDAEVGVLKVSSVFGGKFLPSEHKAVLLAEAGRVAEPVQAGSIIVSRANTPLLVGESAYVEVNYPDLFLPDKLWQTKPSHSEHCVRWLSFFLQSQNVRQEIAKAASGTSGSMKNISKVAFLGIPMPIIPIAEQRKVAEVLLCISNKLDVLQAKQCHFKTLKRGLMQKLLTGEWRVKVDNNQS